VRGVAPDGDNASPFGAMATSVAASYTPQNAYRWRNCATRRAAIHGIRSGTDHVEHEARLREHGDMAGVDLIGGRAHPLRHEAFEVRLDRAVLVGHDVSTRLRLPGGAFNLLVEQVCRRRRVGRLDEVLLLPRQVSRKARDACRSHPEAPIRHFDVGKDVCERELGLLTLRRLVGVRRECSDVDEPSNAGIGPGSGRRG
jgi:hypothetical protein